ncbi:50S ribosomal protein L2 [Candidatus Peregrinibacteria bacterium]|nr:50S ribosomal protein L2 [Candidatus Peregrinibacteria bacterium]
MPVKSFKATTPGRRKMTVIDYSQLSKRGPEKSLLTPKKSIAGRNVHGHITTRHRGGGEKRHYRRVDFLRTDKLKIPARVASIEYDPNRTAFIALLFYADGEKRYILAPEGLKEGDQVVTAENTKPQTGNRMMLKNIPVGIDIHDLELSLKRGGQIVRSAGSSAKLMSLDADMAQVTLPSGEVRFIHKECYASVGIVSNADHMNVVIGKAGRIRKMGRRPQVLGKSMNPVDHPHGGGEGHCPIGLKHPKTPWGMPALGYKTRRRKNPSSRFIIRRKKGKN